MVVTDDELFPAEAEIVHNTPFDAGSMCYRNAALWEYTETAMGVTLYEDETSRLYVYPVDQLPIAADPNDFHSNPLHAAPAIGVAAQSRLLHFFTAPACAAYDEWQPPIAYGLQMRPGVFYDTGAFENESTMFRPGRIALDGTPDARRRGRIVFHDMPSELKKLPARLQLTTAFNGRNNFDVAQAYVDAMHLGDNKLRGRSAFVRAYAGDDGLLLGKAETTFGDLGSAPMLIATGALPIGSVGIVNESTNALESVPQLRYTRHWNNDSLETTFALEENKDLGDVDFNGEEEHWWPTFVGRVRLQSETDEFNSFQVAGLLRPIGFNDFNFEDHAVLAWGLSAVGRLCNEERTDAVYFGVTGGEGIGGYIYGDIKAAEVTSPTSISALSNFGAYVAYQRVWARRGVTENLSSNVAYGCVASDTLAPTDNRRLHQAWCNLLWNASDNTGFGLEYQYASREVGSGNRGDDHRIMFVAIFSTDSDREENAEQTYRHTQETDIRPIQWRRL